MAKTFTASVKKANTTTLKNLRYIAASSIQDVLEAAQTPQLGMTKGADSFEVGKIPVAEATLINSLSVDGGAPSEFSYALAIAELQLGDAMHFAWTAPHSLPMELGFTAKNGRQIPGRHFVGANAPRFVTEFVPKRTAEVAK